MISVVIPTLDAAAVIGPTLGSLAPGLSDGVIRELVIADGGSTDAIGDIAEGVGATFLRAEGGRGAQLAAGAAAARGEWLLFLHADTTLSEGWARAARTHVQRLPGKAGWFRLAFDASGLAPTIVAGWANARARLFGVPFGDQGLLISRALYESVGGHPPIPIMEDVALARALGARRLAPLDARATTSAARYEREGWLRRGARNLSCQALWLAGASPERIARRYAR